METINHEYYVSLEVVKLLKKAGFDWELNSRWQDWGGKNSHEFILKTDLFYTDRPAEYDGFHALPAPTLEVAQRWLREVKAIHICVKPNEASSNCKYFVTVIVNDTKWGNIQDDNRKTIMFDTYEEAQEAGIKKVLEIILEKGE